MIVCRDPARKIRTNLPWAHRYWSVEENVRVHGGRVVQRQVPYLGEINDSQRAAWCRSIELVEDRSRSRRMALLPEYREAPAPNCGSDNNCRAGFCICPSRHCE